METPNCPHWRSVEEIKNGGRCGIKKFRGTISFGVCAACLAGKLQTMEVPAPLPPAVAAALKQARGTYPTERGCCGG